MLKKYAYLIQVEKSLAAELYSSSALKKLGCGTPSQLFSDRRAKVLQLKINSFSKSIDDVMRGWNNLKCFSPEQLD